MLSRTCIHPIVLALLVAPAAADLIWDLEAPEEVTGAHNLHAAEFAEGMLLGRTVWDPFLYLRLPEAEVDVSALPYLTVRMYSSADADLLDVYHKAADGNWGLGGELPVKAGWAVYRVDMRRANWHEGTGAGKKWGGPTGKIMSFRIDPGNQGDRLVAVDQIALTAEPTGPLGIEQEPGGTLEGLRVDAPAAVDAGDAIGVTLRGRFERGQAPAQGHAVVELMRGTTPAGLRVLPVDLRTGEVELTTEFGTSRYAVDGQFRVHAGILELDGVRVPPAQVKVTNPRAGVATPPVTAVAPHGGEPTLFVDGEPVPLMAFVRFGAPKPELDRMYAASGIRVFADWFGGSRQGALGQVEAGVYDYSAYDHYFATVLDAVPGAYFMPHIGVTAPDWWQEAYPEECCLYSNGKLGPSSMASERWKAEMGEDLRRLIAHLRRAPYADRILGYMFYSGYTAEWQMWATWQDYSDDYSAPALAAFHRWLEGRYGTDTALREAWADPDVTLQTAQMPTYERIQDEGSYVRDPAADRQVIDFHRFTSEMVADAIIHFARVTKEACGGEQVAGTYYGYMAAHGARQPRCGHNALAQVLRCPDVDFLMSPPMYANRQLGGTSTFMSATESVKLHGKLWIDESDLRSYLSDPGSGYGRSETADESVAVTWREFANVLTRRVAVTWYDMGGGWFAGEPMLEAYGQILDVARRALNRRSPFHGEVALLVDEDSFAYCRWSDATRQMVGEVVAQMPTAGVTWDTYLLSDIGHAAMPAYKLYVVLNGLSMGQEHRKLLVAKAAAEGATVAYVYAPGYADERSLTPQRVEAATGLSVDMSGAGSGAYHLRPGTWLAEGLDPAAAYGPALELRPRPVIVGDAAEPLATYADGTVAVAETVHEGVRTVTCASAALPPTLLRNLARSAGAHVYCETADAFYTDGQYVALHAGVDGPKWVQLPEARTLTDLRTGEALGQTARLQREMKVGETLFVELD